jgi:hypothetical protein
MSHTIRNAVAVAALASASLLAGAGVASAGDGNTVADGPTATGALNVQPVIKPVIKVVHAQVQPNVNVLSPNKGFAPVNAK